MDSLRGSSVKLGATQRRLAWPLRKDDTHESRSVSMSTQDDLRRGPVYITPPGRGWPGRRAYISLSLYIYIYFSLSLYIYIYIFLFLSHITSMYIL